MDQPQRQNWVTLTDAAEKLGVHRNTMRKRVIQWELTTRQNPRNLREVLVDWAEIEDRLEGFDLGELAA